MIKKNVTIPLASFFILFVNFLNAQITNYNWPTSIPKSTLYEIKVIQNGQSFTIHPHLSTPYKESNWYWPDRDLTDGNDNGIVSYMNDRTMTFGTFSFEGEVTIEVTKLYGQIASRVELSPKVFGINPTSFDGRTVRFKLNHSLSAIAKYISVNFVASDNLDSDSTDGFHIKNNLMLFADKPETNVPDPTSSNVAVFGENPNYQNADIIYFRKGDYNLHSYFNTVFGQEGQMPFFKNNQTIYLEPGTFIRGAFHGTGFDGISLKGRAIVTGQNYPFHWFRNASNGSDAFINFKGCDNITVEGIIIENPSNHSIPSSSRSTINNIKIIGWSFNQDGIRPGNGSVVDQIFIKSQDDYDYARDPHLVKNSVFWPADNGACGMIGWNTLGTGYAEYKNMAFINSQSKSVKKNTGILGSQADDGIKLTNNHFEDIIIEDKHAYLVNVVLTATGPLDPGYLNKFTFKNITTERPFQFTDNTKAVQKMNGLQDNWLSDWKFTNVIIDGTLLTFNNHQNYFNLNLVGTNGNNVDSDNFVQNVTFDTEGSLYQITTTVGSGGTISPSGTNGVISCIGGKDQLLSIVPNSNNRIKSIVVDGVEKYVYGDPFKNERLQSLLFNQLSSNHTVAVTFEAGADYFDTTLKVKENVSKENNLKLYPNPAKNEITILNIQGEFSYSIYDSSGKNIQSETPQTKNCISISDLNSGIYFIEVNTKENVKSSSKFIKL